MLLFVFSNKMLPFLLTSYTHPIIAVWSSSAGWDGSTTRERPHMRLLWLYLLTKGYGSKWDHREHSARSKILPRFYERFKIEEIFQQQHPIYLVS
jgi:hypothetical protein